MYTQNRSVLFYCHCKSITTNNEEKCNPLFQITGEEKISLFSFCFYELLGNEGRLIPSFVDDPNACWFLFIQTQDFVREESRNARILSCGLSGFLHFSSSSLLDFRVICSLLEPSIPPPPFLLSGEGYV